MQVTLNVPVYVDNDFGVDDDGSVHILTFVDISEDDDGLIEVQTSIEKMIEDAIDYWRTDDVNEGISYLSSLADALSRAADRCYDSVQDMTHLRVEDEADSYPMM